MQLFKFSGVPGWGFGALVLFAGFGVRLRYKKVLGEVIPPCPKTGGPGRNSTFQMVALSTNRYVRFLQRAQKRTLGGGLFSRSFAFAPSIATVVLLLVDGSSVLQCLFKILTWGVFFLRRLRGEHLPKRWYLCTCARDPPHWLLGPGCPMCLASFSGRGC